MSGPLEGIRGIVLTQAWAGALCTELMAMMGAEIIQIEVRKRPDSWRGAYDAPILPKVAEQPTAQHPWNCSPLFNSVNLGKQSITLDLSIPEGIDIYRRLVPFADVVAENFSPRVMKNLGLHYEALCEIKPDIILASLSAYGATGPYFNVPGIGGTIEPMSGMSYLLGYEDGPPMNSGAMFPDAIAGFYGFAAIATALLHRDRTGEGQYIDLSMQEANLTVIGEAALEYSMTGNVRGRLGNRHRTFAPHGIYPAAGDDRWVAIAAESEEQWRALVEAAGHPEWASDARFADNAARKANEDVLDAAIAAWTASEDRDALADRLARGGVIAAPVLDGLELAEDPVLREREYVVDVTHPETGTWPQIGLPMHLDRTPGSVPRPAPLQGEHSAEVLERFLGIGRDEYEELVRKGVTGSGPPD
jgi:crotonobetainyl-CoA:carnitine CoA-transferase CaiB-like acyl-CoA transferase